MNAHEQGGKKIHYTTIIINSVWLTASINMLQFQINS